MSDKRDDKPNNDTLLIVQAINNQTAVIQKVLDKLEKTSNENQKILEQISSNRCINSSMEYNCFSVKFKTFMMMLLLLQIMILLSINEIDVSMVQSIILSLIQ